MTDEAAFAAALQSAKAGDETAWRMLVDDVLPTVLDLARGARHPDPEDIAADVLVGMVRGLGRFTGARDNLRAWVATIARRRLGDWQARQARRPELLGDPPNQPDEVQAAELDRVADLADLEALLCALDERQREVVVLRTVVDVPADDVAARVGTSAGNVRVITCRALARLREVAREL